MSIHLSGVKAIYTPFTKVETDNPSNYRGIVFNSCIGKLFTKILNSRLNEFLAKRNVTPIEQIGFAKKKRQ